MIKRTQIKSEGSIKTTRLQVYKTTSLQILLSRWLVDFLHSSFELLSFLNARIREFVGEWGFAVKDAIYQELSKKLKDKGLKIFVLILDNSDGVSANSNGVWEISNGVQKFSNGVWENSNGVWIFKNPISDLSNAFSEFSNAVSSQKHAT